MAEAMKLLSTKETALRLGVTERWVRLMCQLKRIGKRVGGRWVIGENELQALKRNRRPRGRPKKSRRS